MEDNKSKAEALNKQFRSVFTNEDMSTLPQMGTIKTQDISSIQIQEKGIAKLLSKLNINKASGPDTISIICSIILLGTDVKEISL
jgi:hypothetical protein